jgi:hypothetical protein
VSPPAAATRWRGRVAVMALLIVAVTVGLLSVGRTMLQRQSEEGEAAVSEPPKLEVIRPGSPARNRDVEFPVARPADELKDVAVPAPEAGALDEPTSARKMGADTERVLPTDTADPTESAPVKGREGNGAVMAAARAGAGPHSAKADASVPAAAQSTYAAAAHDVAVRSKEGSEVGAATAPAAPAREVAQIVPASAQLRPAAAQIAKIDETVSKADASVSKAEPVEQGKRREPAPAEAVGSAAGAGVAGDHELGRRLRLDGMQFAQVVVRGGDSISGIALHKYGQASYTILDLLKLANPELKDINVIAIGQTIRLPELGDAFPILRDGSGQYSLLVYSSPQGARASALQDALRSRGFNARVSQGSVGYQKPVFRVVVSGESDREGLAALGRQLQKLFREDTRIARLGG